MPTSTQLAFPRQDVKKSSLTISDGLGRTENKEGGSGSQTHAIGCLEIKLYRALYVRHGNPNSLNAVDRSRTPFNRNPYALLRSGNPKPEGVGTERRRFHIA